MLKKRYARIENGLVVEIIETEHDINQQFHPDFVSQMVECDDTVNQGFTFENGVFHAPVFEEINPLIEWRKTATISKKQALLNLEAVGLLQQIFDYMDALPRTHSLRIEFYESQEYHRNNLLLVDFCQDVLGLTSEQIDQLFSIQ